METKRFVALVSEFKLLNVNVVPICLTENSKREMEGD